MNLLAPGAGETVVTRAHVVKAGRTLTVSTVEVFAVAGGREKLVAITVATNVSVRDRPGSSIEGRVTLRSKRCACPSHPTADTLSRG